MEKNRILNVLPMLCLISFFLNKMMHRFHFVEGVENNYDQNIIRYRVYGPYSVDLFYSLHA